MSQRSLSSIANEINELWAKKLPSHYFGAVPYLRAMRELDTLRDSYGADSARSIVAYFLSNAAGWRGEDARRIKKELNDMLRSNRHETK